MTSHSAARAAAHLPGRTIRPLIAALAVLAAAACGGDSDDASRDLQSPPEAPPPQNGLTLGAVLATNSPGWGPLLTKTGSPGALVLAVLPGSAAEGAGLEAGSVIVSFDGENVRGADRVTLLLRTAGSGDHTLEFVAPAGARVTAPVQLLPSTRNGPLVFMERRVQEAPQDMAALYILALLNDDPARALAASEVLARTVPAFAEGRVLAARALVDSNRAPSGVPPAVASTAGAAMQRAMELDPSSADVAASAARLFIDLGQPGDARRPSVLALRNDPASARANAAFAMVQLASGRPTQAVPALSRAIALDPYEAENYTALAKAYRELGQTRSAEATEDALRLMTEGTTERRPGPGSGPVALALATVLVGVAAPVALRERRHRRDKNRAEQIPFAPSTRRIAEATVIAGVALVSVPYLGPWLGFVPETNDRLALMDHLVPGLVASGAALAWIATSSRAQSRTARVAPPIAVLAGLFSTSAHGPLAIEAAQGGQAWGTALFHSVAAPVVLVLTAMLLARSRRSSPADDPSPE